MPVKRSEQFDQTVVPLAHLHRAAVRASEREKSAQTSIQDQAEAEEKDAWVLRLGLGLLSDLLPP